MKKWFEYQESLQKNLKTTDKKNFIEFNIGQEIETIRKYLFKKNWKNSSIVCFKKEEYINLIMDSYSHLNLDKKVIESWINDPQFNDLMEVSGKQNCVEIDDLALKLLKKILMPYFKIDWSTAEIKLNVQTPGQLFPLHYDMFKSFKYEQTLEEENNIQRWLIMLDDRKPGQCFFMDNTDVNWKKGDVIAWTQVTVPHGSANFGYWPRFNIRLTGKNR